MVPRSSREIEPYIEPGEDGVVVRCPVRGGRCIRRRGVGGADDVVGEAVAAERDEEELPPLGIVGFLQIEGDRDRAFDGGDIGSGATVLG